MLNAVVITVYEFTISFVLILHILHSAYTKNKISNIGIYSFVRKKRTVGVPTGIHRCIINI